MCLLKIDIHGVLGLNFVGLKFLGILLFMGLEFFGNIIICGFKICGPKFFFRGLKISVFLVGELGALGLGLVGLGPGTGLLTHACAYTNIPPP